MKFVALSTAMVLITTVLVANPTGTPRYKFPLNTVFKTARMVHGE